MSGSMLVRCVLLLVVFSASARAAEDICYTGAAQSLAAGEFFTCALLDTAVGSVKCWGANCYGQLGQGDTNDRGGYWGEMGHFLPAVDLGGKAVSLCAGQSHACAILDGGDVKCWGENDAGQLGLGDTENRGDDMFEMGDNLTAVDLGTGLTAVSIACGEDHTCAVLDDGSVKCWGYNDYGQLGQGDNSDRGDEEYEMGDNLTAVNLGTGRTAVSIACGEYHTCAVLDDGSVKCWGANEADIGWRRTLGQGDADDRGDDPNEMGDYLPAVELGAGRTVQSIAAGYDHTCAVLDDASVKCWGGNLHGQLGHEFAFANIQEFEPEYYSNGERGFYAYEMGDYLPATDLMSLACGAEVSAAATPPTCGQPAAQAACAGYAHTCAVLDDGSVKCWGENSEGQLGIGDSVDRGDDMFEMGANLTTVDLGTGRTAVNIACGNYFTCAILDDESVKCWGDNNYGQLGQGDDHDRGDDEYEMGDYLPAVDLGPGRTAVGIACGNQHACALLDNGKVVCWGDQEDGAFGLSLGTLYDEDEESYTGILDAQMGENLIATDLGTGRTAVKVAAGYNSETTCAILDNGRVKCWGENTDGVLGQGDESDRGDEPQEMGDKLRAVSLGLGRTAVDISTAHHHVCVVLDDGSVKCWGDNYYGQLGQGDNYDRGDDENEMGNNLPAVDLGTGRTAVSIACGAVHTCAVLDDGSVKCWGENSDGQLGIGDSVERGDDEYEMGDNLTAVDLGAGRTAVSIACGPYYSCAVLDDGSVKCWGDNGDGELGIGDDYDRGDDEYEMGDNLTAIDLTVCACGPGYSDMEEKGYALGKQMYGDAEAFLGPDYLGFFGQDLSETCYNVNECEYGLHNCDAMASYWKTEACTDTAGSFSCACPAGFVWNADAARCDDIDECALAPCHKNATCMEPKPNAFACACNRGFVGDGKTCTTQVRGSE